MTGGLFSVILDWFGRLGCALESEEVREHKLDLKNPWRNLGSQESARLAS